MSDAHRAGQCSSSRSAAKLLDAAIDELALARTAQRSFDTAPEEYLTYESALTAPNTAPNTPDRSAHNSERNAHSSVSLVRTETTLPLGCDLPGPPATTEPISLPTTPASGTIVETDAPPVTPVRSPSTPIHQGSSCSPMVTVESSQRACTPFAPRVLNEVDVRAVVSGSPLPAPAVHLVLNFGAPATPLQTRQPTAVPGAPQRSRSNALSDALSARFSAFRIRAPVLSPPQSTGEFANWLSQPATGTSYPSTWAAGGARVVWNAQGLLTITFE